MLRAKAKQSAPTASTIDRLVWAVLEFIAFLLKFVFLKRESLNPVSPIVRAL
jgi:hypothetical protein